MSLGSALTVLAAREAARVALFLGLALATMPLLRRARAQVRRLVVAFALGGALVLPAIATLGPAWPVLPSPVRALAAPFAEPLAEPRTGPAAAPTPGAAADAAPRARGVAGRSLDGGAVLAAVWALGAILVLARLGAGLYRAGAIVRRSTPAASFSQAVAEAERRTGVRVSVRATDELDAPAVTGIAKPTVLVPLDADAWTDERRLAVLLHEIAHVAQRDCLVQIVAQLTCAAHWFDPLAWALARRLRREREIAADDAVIAGGVLPTTYAEALLAIGGAHAAPAGAVGMADGRAAGESELGARVTAILATGRARGPLSPAAAGVIVAAASCVALAIACASPDVPEASPSRPLGAGTTVAAPAPAAGTTTIDPRVQNIAEEELERALAEWQGSAGAIVVLDPATGEILANAGREHGARADVGSQRAYATGSTLKAIVLAAALEEGAVAPADRFDCDQGARAYGSRTLNDSHPNGVLTLPEMLAVSSNVGFSKVFDRLGGDRLGRWLLRFHFGAAPGDAPTRVEDRSYEGALLALGQGLRASPLQVAAAYATLANDGVYVEPTLTHRAAPAPGEAVVTPKTARLVVGMLEEAVHGEKATGAAARVANVRVAGKTGTADHATPDGHDAVYASFVGMLPAGRSRYVILVGVDAPRAGGWGGTVGAPAFARVASRILGD
jgi:beta-lactamase regulating signal transducer with metallopeptidase domain